MICLKQRNAFTMLELVFVIVVIGILSAVAIPKLAATRDDAVITKARTTVAAVRNSVATERQQRILKGDFVNVVNTLSTDPANIFDRFNPDRDNIANGTQPNRVLEYPVATCATLGKSRGCWQLAGANYRYTFPDGNTIDFVLDNTGRFDCVNVNAPLCRLMTQ